MDNQLTFRLSTLDRAATKSDEAADKIGGCEVGRAIHQATLGLPGSRASIWIDACVTAVEDEQCKWVSQIREHSADLKASATNYRVNEDELKKAFRGNDSTPFNREDDNK